ncbi:MAG: FHA domain-containing protein [Calothrix sp. SM1_7_51]|nr:FHA domain-containing protein [Calothrix sp. SM1_7_51]
MPSLNLAIARLVNIGTDTFAIWAVNAPYSSGNVLRDCVWPHELTKIWEEWQDMFANHERLDVVPPGTSQHPNAKSGNIILPPINSDNSYTGRLMQSLGMNLWHWVFNHKTLDSLERSQGIAIGQRQPLRFRLDVRDPLLTPLPWEIMQREPGQPTMSLGQTLLFSRTTSTDEPLTNLRSEQALKILVVLGADSQILDLEKEADMIEQSLNDGAPMGSNSFGYAPCMVKTLLEPTPKELIGELERGGYNVLFYTGHGQVGPDGGYLQLRSDMLINGMQLGQVLKGSGVKLAVFNACWGAQPDSVNSQAIPYSSLAEVQIRLGVPAVLGMRDIIKPVESQNFINALANGLRKRLPIDQAVAEARQQLLKLHGFNHPAWTLPVLYLHPEFNGELLRSFFDGITELPTEMPETAFPDIKTQITQAKLRSLSGGITYNLRKGITRIGRTPENDIVIPEPSLSRRHAEILYRNTEKTYYLEDFSTYGTTWISSNNVWQQIHRREVPLEPGMLLKFGSTRTQSWEFVIEDEDLTPNSLLK